MVILKRVAITNENLGSRRRNEGVTIENLGRQGDAAPKPACPSTKEADADRGLSLQDWKNGHVQGIISLKIAVVWKYAQFIRKIMVCISHAQALVNVQSPREEQRLEDFPAFFPGCSPEWNAYLPSWQKSSWMDLERNDLHAQMCLFHG